MRNTSAFSTCLTGLLMLGLATQAEAREFHLLDVGARADLGYGHTFGTPTEFQSQEFADVGLRIDFLYILGIEGTYKPLSSLSSDNLDARWTASGIIYLYSNQYADIYFKAGVGALNAGHLFSGSAQDTTVHTGLGLEVQVDDNWQVGVEFLAIGQGIGTLKTLANEHVTTPSSYEPQEFNVTIGARYFLNLF